LGYGLVLIKDDMKRLFVIQEHDANRAGLHWDLRFECLQWQSAETYKERQQGITPKVTNIADVNRVLRSFCLPKHKLPNIGERILAIPVEDHAWEYRNFEGTIPNGSYGYGSVKLIFCDYIDVPLFEADRIRFCYQGISYQMFKCNSINNWLIQRDLKR
jgi:hypothetical protein